MSVRTSPDEAILTGLIALLRATSAVTALATGGVYNNVPQGTAYPYVEVTAPTAARKDTFGQLGATTLVDIKAITQGFGDREGVRIRDAVIQAIDSQKPTVVGQTIFGIAWESNERIEDVVAGIRTRYHVASFRVWTGQS